MLDSCIEIITGYNRQKSAQNDRRTQFENKEEAGPPSVLNTLDAVINENARCLSLKCVRLPIESARLYKEYLPLAFGQLFQSIIDIFVQQIPGKERNCLKVKLGIIRDHSEPHFIETSCQRYTFVFRHPNIDGTTLGGFQPSSTAMFATFRKRY